MFDVEWAYKDDKNITLKSLPYFYTNPVTQEVIEMTNCSEEDKKNLGWYNIVFKTNSGSRANTYYENIHTLQYNQLNNTVECLSFTLKSDWRQLIYDNMISYITQHEIYINNKKLYDSFLLKVKKYFNDEKYDAYQIERYADILKRLFHDIVSFTQTSYYKTYGGIFAPELQYSETEIFRQKQHMLRYIASNIAMFKNKNVVVTGTPSYTNAVLLAKNKIKVSVLDNRFTNPGEGEFHIALNAIICAVNNNVWYDIIEEEFYDFSENDILIFDGAFTGVNFEKNWTMAIEAKKKGKHVLICSPSIWNGTNPNISILRSEFINLYEYEGDVVFTLK